MLKRRRHIFSCTPVRLKWKSFCFLRVKILSCLRRKTERKGIRTAAIPDFEYLNANKWHTVKHYKKYLEDSLTQSTRGYYYETRTGGWTPLCTEWYELRSSEYGKQDSSRSIERNGDTCNNMLYLNFCWHKWLRDLLLFETLQGSMVQMYR